MMEALDLALLCEASAALVRLDERLSGSRAPVRAGWLARAVMHEAAASARLDEVYVDAQDLLLFEHDQLPRLSDHGIQAAHRGLIVLRAAQRRDPRRLFTPLRAMAAARLRFRGAMGAETIGSDRLRERLDERRADPEEARACLNRALDPLALRTFQLAPALLGAAGFLARWHACGAAGAAGGLAGRALAAGWLRRVGLVRLPVPLPGVGFLGHAAEYGIRTGDGWNNVFLAASLRGAEWGLALLERMRLADRRLTEAAMPRRRSSHLLAVIDLLLASPGVSARSLARDLGLSLTAVRALLRQIEARHPLQELTGQGTFRIFSVL